MKTFKLDCGCVVDYATDRITVPCASCLAHHAQAMADRVAANRVEYIKHCVICSVELRHPAGYVCCSGRDCGCGGELIAADRCSTACHEAQREVA